MMVDHDVAEKIQETAAAGRSSRFRGVRCADRRVHIHHRGAGPSLPGAETRHQEVRVTRHPV
ncbi:hypothetical protein CD790_27535 [Streptomyces sp. SAJ15]|nr:hypothetical protein CD790_27535 [Streptomyces sp. SAJ15]